MRAREREREKEREREREKEKDRERQTEKERDKGKWKAVTTAAATVAARVAAITVFSCHQNLSSEICHKTTQRRLSHDPKDVPRPPRVVAMTVGKPSRDFWRGADPREVHFSQVKSHTTPST